MKYFNTPDNFKYSRFSSEHKSELWSDPAQGGEAAPVPIPGGALCVPGDHGAGHPGGHDGCWAAAPPLHIPCLHQHPRHDHL